MSKSEIGHLVGKRLREVRLQAGLTQPELGDRASMAAAEISKCENGRRTPTLETLERLARALGVTVQDLVTVQDPRDEQEMLLDQIVLRLRGQSTATLQRVAAVVDALVRVG